MYIRVAGRNTENKPLTEAIIGIYVVECNAPFVMLRGKI